MNIIKPQKGFSLIELVVAMGIFLTVVTLAIGAFVSVSRMKQLTSIAKEVQQKTRIATEMITRLSRQADKVITAPDNSNYVELYFNLKNTNPDYGTRFEIDTTTGELAMYECGAASCSGTQWTNKNELLGGTIKLNTAESYFKKTGTIPPRLQVRLNGQILGINNSAFYSNEITIDTDVILESIK